MMQNWWRLLRETVSRWSAHKDGRLGAALAYYSIFSIAGLVFGAEAVQGIGFRHVARSARQIRHFGRMYILSLAGVLAVGFLLLMSMLVTAAIWAAGKYTLRLTCRSA